MHSANFTMFKLEELEPINFIIEGARFFNFSDKQIILRRKDASSLAYYWQWK